jgi:hypothetical protein
MREMCVLASTRVHVSMSITVYSHMTGTILATEKQRLAARGMEGEINP